MGVLDVTSSVIRKRGMIRAWLEMRNALPFWGDYLHLPKSVGQTISEKTPGLYTRGRVLVKQNQCLRFSSLIPPELFRPRACSHQIVLGLHHLA